MYSQIPTEMSKSSLTTTVCRLSYLGLHTTGLLIITIIRGTTPGAGVSISVPSDSMLAGTVGMVGDLLGAGGPRGDGALPGAGHGIIPGIPVMVRVGDMVPAGGPVLTDRWLPTVPVEEHRLAPLVRDMQTTL